MYLYTFTAELPFPYIGITFDHLNYMEGSHDGFHPAVTVGPDRRTLVHLFIPSKTKQWATMLGEKLITSSNPPQLRGPILGTTTRRATESDLAPTAPGNN